MGKDNGCRYASGFFNDKHEWNWSSMSKVYVCSNGNGQCGATKKGKAPTAPTTTRTTYSKKGKTVEEVPVRDVTKIKGSAWGNKTDRKVKPASRENPKKDKKGGWFW